MKNGYEWFDVIIFLSIGFFLNALISVGIVNTIITGDIYTSTLTIEALTILIVGISVPLTIIIPYFLITWLRTYTIISRKKLHKLTEIVKNDKEE